MQVMHARNGLGYVQVIEHVECNLHRNSMAVHDLSQKWHDSIAKCAKAATARLCNIRTQLLFASATYASKSNLSEA